MIQLAVTAGHSCRDFFLFFRRKDALGGLGTEFAAQARMYPYISQLHSQTLLEPLALHRVQHFTSYKKATTDGDDNMIVYILRP